MLFRCGILNICTAQPESKALPFSGLGLEFQGLFAFRVCLPRVFAIKGSKELSYLRITALSCLAWVRLTGGRWFHGLQTTKTKRVKTNLHGNGNDRRTRKNRYKKRARRNDFLVDYMFEAQG